MYNKLGVSGMSRTLAWHKQVSGFNPQCCKNKSKLVMKSLRKGIVEDAEGEQDWGAWHTVRNPLFSWPLPEERKCSEAGRKRESVQRQGEEE